MVDKLRSYPWWDYLSSELQDLLVDAFGLYELLLVSEHKFGDYSFVVFPAAKAYEGFLKKLFLDMNFIDKKTYESSHFRIGKALNPFLDKKYRKEGWVYDKLAKYCKGRELPDTLWDTWKQSRNLVFHWFPERKNYISLPECKPRLEQIVNSIDAVFEECRVNIEV